MTFLGNSSVILNFTHNVSNQLCNNYVYTQFLHLVSLFNENDKNITYLANMDIVNTIESFVKLR